MLEIHVSEAQISNFFLGAMLPDSPSPQKLASFFHLTAYSKALKYCPTWNLLKTLLCVIEKSHQAKGCCEGVETILHYH